MRHTDHISMRRTQRRETAQCHIGACSSHNTQTSSSCLLNLILEDKIPLRRKFLNPREQTVLLKGPALNHFTCLYFPSPTPVEQPCTINHPVSWIDPLAKFQCEAQAVKALLCLPHVENRRNTRWALRVCNKTPVGGCPLWHHRGVISRTLCFRAPSEKWSN